jgi:PKD repeat protein
VRARNRFFSTVTAVLAGALALLGLTVAPAAHAAAGTLSFVAADSKSFNSTSHRLTIPAAVAANDTLVVLLTTNSTTSTIGATPTGWTLLKSVDGSGTRGRLYTKQATAADLGKTVTVTTSAAAKSVMSIAAYRSSTGTSSVTASALTAVNAAASSATTPSVPVTDAGSWLLSDWTDKSSTAHTWTTPASVTVRKSVYVVTSGAVSGVLTDSNGPVATGTAAGRTATTSAAVGRNISYSVVVSPGSSTTPTNHAPVPSFTSSCGALTCSFDATGTTDSDGDALTYAWTYGDGASGTGATPTHKYATAGTRTVTLTVSDGKTTASTTRSVVTTSSNPTPGHTRLVPQTPRTDEPKINDGEIWDIEVVGSRVFIAGSFTSIANNRSGNTTSYSQPSIASYNMDTGLVDSAFRPVIGGGGVESVEASPDGKRLYIAGDFNAVNGVTKKGVAQIDMATGAPVAGFTANTDAKATELAVSGSTVYVGGKFKKVNSSARRSLAAVDATTGAVDPGFVNDLSGGLGVNGEITVQKLKLTHDESKLLVVHTASQVAGQDRSGVALIDTATKKLLPWRTQLWDDNLQFVGGIQRVYGGDISPDDSYFVVSSGSGGDRPPVNDTAIRFPINVPAGQSADDVQPAWIARNFDSTYSVAITEKAVYLGGHFAWNESPSAPDPWPGQDDIGYGTGQGLSGYALGDSVVNREHLGALDPATGKALEWSPGSNSYEGNKTLEATPRGLFSGGDATTQGGYNVGRVAFFDFNNETASNGLQTNITKPIMGRVVPSATDFTLEGTASTTTGTVSKVNVTLQDRSTKRYLQSDLKTWATSAATLSPKLADTGVASTTWSLPLNVAGNVKMQAVARTYNSAGTAAATKATKKFETFGLADKTPTVNYTGPSSSSPVRDTSFTITGTASDDIGVTGLSMTIRDSHDRYLQDDGTASASYNSFHITPDVSGATSTTWSKDVTVPYEDTWKAQTRATDTAGQSSLDTSDRSWIVSLSGQAPVVSLSSPVTVTPPTAPQPFTVEPGKPLTFKGSASDDGGVTAVDVALTNTSTGDTLMVDGSFSPKSGLNFYRVTGPNLNQKTVNWSFTTGFNLTPGLYTFVVRATDNDGFTTPQSNWVFITNMTAGTAGDAAPKATVTSPMPGVLTTNLVDKHVSLSGTATDAAGGGVTGVRMVVKDADTARYLQPDGTTSSSYATVPATTVASTGAGVLSTGWTYDAVLPTQGDWTISAKAVDTSGQSDLNSVGGSARFLVYPGDAAPTFEDTLTAPTEGASFADGKIFISGRADDNTAMAKVEVSVQDKTTGKYMSSNGSVANTNPTWIGTFLTSPGTPGSNFSYTTPVIPAGSYLVSMRATDTHDLVSAVTTRNVTVSLPANNPPVAHLTKSCTNNVCTFDARTSTDEHAATLTYAWTFTNATTNAVSTSTGPVVTKTFSSAATYNVSLVAKDEYLSTSTPATDSVTITEPATNKAPNAVFNTPACSALSCNFSALGTTDDSGDVDTYSWNWGDGSLPSTGANASHTFAGTGPYHVVLTVTDGWGKATSVPLDLTVPGP